MKRSIIWMVLFIGNIVDIWGFHEYRNETDLKVNVEAQLKSALCTDRHIVLGPNEPQKKIDDLGSCSIKKVYFVITDKDGSQRRTVITYSDGVSMGGGDWYFTVKKNKDNKFYVAYGNTQTMWSPIYSVNKGATNVPGESSHTYNRGGSKNFDEYRNNDKEKYSYKPQ